MVNLTIDLGEKQVLKMKADQVELDNFSKQLKRRNACHDSKTSF